MNNVYKDKVRLLLRIIPIVMDQECFAIHGGTAINLFMNDLLRLSVDIDLTYIPLENRTSSINHIHEALVRISSRIKELLKGVRVIPRLDICKLTCEYHGCQVKIEVNQTKRGIVGGEPVIIPLCQKAQDMFEMEVEARIVPLTQLYGGKIAAALSRQHPRDMFDINHMSISFDEAKYGFIFCLLGSDRPIHESFAPSLIDQKEAMDKQFAGMSDLDFTYNDYEETKSKLIENVKNIMTEEDKHFLVSFEQGNPAWEESVYGDFAKYPSVTWKLLNLNKLKKTNPKKLEKEAELLENILRG
ncbi:MAG: nucleotidyl transferase AbiEii/AbiGii toxin family protein [Bacteroides sp.]|jgi:predicted nucleotidyltransferase component of viral defense system|nr:nucleotidyl transferase AbiEii/AbiGii toxin family protein [Bacteroides sp.]